MVLSFKEEKELEELKQKNKVQILEFQLDMVLVEHKQKKERLALLLEIAKAGGIKNGSV